MHILLGKCRKNTTLADGVSRDNILKYNYEINF